MMETLTDRMTRHLLKRLRRRDVLTLYERAADAGLLTFAFIGGEERKGTVWHMADQARHVLTGNPALDRKIVRRMMGASGALPLRRVEPDGPGGGGLAPTGFPGVPARCDGIEIVAVLPCDLDQNSLGIFRRNHLGFQGG